MTTAEQNRLAERSTETVPPWRKWGTYVSDRAWGTVREDYSEDGDAWRFFPHDLARSKAFRWGEDAIAGWCDRYQLLVFGWAFWNGRDPILKERLFGLVPSEANHGEDVKEYYFHLDATPTHSYCKFLYKYPQAEFPYAQLIAENQKRSPEEREFELLDTGIFNDDRYFDIFIEYAKAGADDTCIRIEICNRAAKAASIHVLPQLWFRNTWGWTPPGKPVPAIKLGRKSARHTTLEVGDKDVDPLANLPVSYSIGALKFHGPPGATPLFTENDTNCERVFGNDAKSRTPFVKDAFHRHIIGGDDCVNPANSGSKAGLHYAKLEVPALGSVVLRFRLTDKKLTDPLAEVDTIVSERRVEADEFYHTIHPAHVSVDEKHIQRTALAGLLWTKQIYIFNVHTWLKGDNPNWKPPASRKTIRNTHWRHIHTMRVMTMPDKWEYPWFAAWDLAFQAVPLALVDPDYAKEQLWLLLFEQFQHPSGQIPAYEWEFSDLNPPVHAWAVWRVFNMDRIRSGKPDRLFLEKCFHKLLLNFTWWVNRVDDEGNNVFEGGFLGLDNITLIDRSLKFASGAKLQQSDATGWMGMFCLNLMRIALELAKENKAYENLAFKFFEHFLYIGAAMKDRGGKGYELWDERDGFFYDVLEFPNGSFHKFRVRSLVGLIPLFAVERLEEEWIKPFPEFYRNFHWILKNRPDLVDPCVTTMQVDGQTSHVLAVIEPEQMRRVLSCVWNPAEFRSDYGLRSLSKFHEKNPVQYKSSTVRYEPAEALEKLKGGNSNWRGPIWLPTSFMMIEALRKLRKAYGKSFTVPASHPEQGEVTLEEMAHGFSNRLIQMFSRDVQDRRAIHGASEKFQTDPHWRDLPLFHEYFHGDTGEGLGASHQTGWTALVASLIDEWRK